MKQFEINAHKRENFTKAAVKQLRREGMVPCVLYGNDTENIHFAVLEKDLKDLIYTPSSYIISINIDGKKSLCILHQTQFHPVSDKILHLDFLAIDPAKPITIQVPVSISGNSEGVRQGGKLQVLNRKLLISGFLKDLPDQLNLDVTDLVLGKAITAGDLKYDNIRIMSPRGTIICMVKMTRASTSATATAVEETEEKPAEA
ncbi:MAG TPA: 50S ribosomal protein L25/general stress protein Ctc [Bacteroidales bacterium]|jgi:large subunit ribosomal protein L25|nr:50S ribosomal protein L25/general stress protein Ctc [Bacteroidales bacterium]OQB69355.1 MAG: 50S ribosomal protein L25 [Bacteroidetes bacterium ADurb.Bin139]HOG25004.1 50S ribosomal protein L25/general stress protein Ctc [Bacteroidales bacterium]HOR11757.1 50S ribosomal protein L25/general stress protein Ctc [Bacteroidales bacterium]HOZ19156.1 50S ribosomal protein L25/general stress protein Ctc [Bacteroidales bacterium]